MLTPLYDQIVVERDPVQETTEAGIILTAGCKEPPNTGTVLAVGEGRLCTSLAGPLGFAHVEPLRVKVGDRIVFQSYAGSELQEGASKRLLVLMSEDDVMAILTPDPESEPNDRIKLPDLPARDDSRKETPEDPDFQVKGKS